MWSVSTRRGARCTARPMFSKNMADFIYTTLVSGEIYLYIIKWSSAITVTSNSKSGRELIQSIRLLHRPSQLYTCTIGIIFMQPARCSETSKRFDPFDPFGPIALASTGVVFTAANRRKRAMSSRQNLFTIKTCSFLCDFSRRVAKMGEHDESRFFEVWRSSSYLSAREKPVAPPSSRSFVSGFTHRMMTSSACAVGLLKALPMRPEFNVGC